VFLKTTASKPMFSCTDIKDVQYCAALCIMSAKVKPDGISSLDCLTDNWVFNFGFSRHQLEGWCQHWQYYSYWFNLS